MKTSFAAAYLVVLSAIFGLGCIAWAVVTVGRAEFASTFVSVVFAIGAGAMAVMMVAVAFRAVSPRVKRVDSGLLVRPDRTIDASLMTVTAGAVIGMGSYAMLESFGVLDVPVPPTNARYLAVTCGIGALVGLVSVRQIIRRRGTSYLLMTAKAIELGNTMSSVEWSWNEVTEIRDKAKNARRGSGTTYLVGPSGRVRVLPTDWYVPKGQALRTLIQFYWKHPEARHELADDRAAERLDVLIHGQ
jgi:hypothetical protein